MRARSFFLTLLLLASFGCGGGLKMKDIAGGGDGVRGSGNVKSETRNLSGFKKIKVSSAVVLNVTVGKEFGVVVEADDNLLDHVTTEVSGDSLAIGTRDSISAKSDIKATVTMPELAGLDLSGASNATVAGTAGENLKIVASGASKVKIDGRVKELHANASGASNINAESLAVENAEAEASGASTIIVNASGKADLNASGASTVVYAGDPRELKQDSSGASTIRKK